MKKLFWLPLVIAALATMGQTHGSGGLRPPLALDSADLGVAWPDTISDGKSRFYIRFDDGTDDQFEDNHIPYFLRKGLNVTVAIDPSTIGNAGVMTWAELRALQALAAENDVTLDVWTHVEFSASDDTDAEFRANLDYSDITDELGVVPSTFLLGGGAASKAAAFPKEVYLKELAREMGYRFAIFNGSNSKTGNSFGGLYPGLVSEGTTKVTSDTWNGGVRPGQCVDPYSMIGGGISDLGNTFVERVSSPTGVDDWYVIGEGGVVSNAWASKSYWYKTGINLSGGLWFSYVIHDSVRSSGPGSEFDIGDGGGSKVQPKNYSPMHVAWACSALVAQGFATDITGTQYNNGMMSYYRPGVDLVSNPGFDMAQFAIGDTNGIMEYALPSGLGTNGWSQANYDNLVAWGPISDQELDTNNAGRYDWDNGIHPTQVLGPAVTGAFEKAGGFHIKPGGGTRWDKMYLSWGGLRPGVYEFSWWQKNSGTQYCTISDMTLWGSRIGYANRDNFNDEDLYTSVDSVSTLSFMGNSPTSVNLGPHGGGAVWTKSVMYIKVPSYVVEDDWGVDASDQDSYWNVFQSWKTDWSWTFGISLAFGTANTYIGDMRFIYYPLRD